MKKIFFAVMAVAAISFASCGGNEGKNDSDSIKAAESAAAAAAAAEQAPADAEQAPATDSNTTVSE